MHCVIQIALSPVGKKNDRNSNLGGRLPCGHPDPHDRTPSITSCLPITRVAGRGPPLLLAQTPMTERICEKPNTKMSKIRDHVASHGSSQKDQCQRAHSTLSTQIIISSTLHHLSKLDFRHHLILPVFISLPSQDLCFTPLLSLSSSRFISSFDMVAEQADSGPGSLATSFCPSCQVTTTTVTTARPITSSSGEKVKHLWSQIQKELDIKMFSSDPKLNPRLPSPTSFDGVKPSYVEWSEEILTFLSVTDYQEFVPILQAVTGHKDVITKKVFIEGILSEIVEEIKEKNTELEEVTSGVRIVDDQDTEVERLKGEIKTLEDKRDSRGLTLIKADNFLRYVLLHSTSGDPNVMVRRIMRTTSSDSEVVTGLESGVKWQSPMQFQLKLE